MELIYQNYIIIFVWFKIIFLSINSLDIAQNRIEGTIPTEFGVMSFLSTIDAMDNQLEGTIPSEMVKMNPNLRLNFTDNL
jgi:hypothetical protein